MGARRGQVLPTLIGHIEELGREKERGPKKAFHLLFQMINTKHFVRHLVYLLKQMVANFIRANKDTEMEGRLLRAVIGETGQTVDQYIVQLLFTQSIRPNTLCLHILAVVLRISLEVIGCQEYSGRANGSKRYAAALPNCTVNYNDSLQLHNEVLPIYVDEIFNVRCLYTFTNEEGIYNYKNLPLFGAVTASLRSLEAPANEHCDDRV